MNKLCNISFISKNTKRDLFLSSPYSIKTMSMSTLDQLEILLMNLKKCEENFSFHLVTKALHKFNGGTEPNYITHQAFKNLFF